MKIGDRHQFREKFKLRKKIREEAERATLKEAIMGVEMNPAAGKKLKGEFAHLRAYPYAVKGQARRLIYAWHKDAIVLFSFGPRGGIYK